MLVRRLRLRHPFGLSRRCGYPLRDAYSYDWSLGGGAEGWSAVLGANPGSFLSLTSPTTVTGNGTLSIDYSENLGVERMGEVVFSTNGGTGGPATFTLTITQLGAGPTITVDPLLPLAASPEGMVMSTITLGGGAEGWSAVLGANPGSFLTLPTDPSGMGSGSLNIRYSENLGVERMGEVVFTTNGGTGGPATFTLTITQLGAGPTITVTPSDYPDVVATPSGTIIPMIALGGGAEGWSAVLGANPGSFLSLTSPTTVTGSCGSLSIDYSENLGVERMGEVVFTTNGGTGGPATFTLTITQLGAGPTITVTPSDYPDVVATPSGTIIPMIALGGGAEGWSAVLGANPGSFLSLTSPTTVTGNAAPCRLIIRRIWEWNVWVKWYSLRMAGRVDRLLSR